MSQPDNSISAAKVQQNFETTKDKEQKKNCLLLHHSAPIAGASVKAAHGAALESQNTNLIARANSSSPEIWRIKGF